MWVRLAARATMVPGARGRGRSVMENASRTALKSMSMSMLMPMSMSMSQNRSFSELLNYPIVPKKDFGDYQEYSVIHTNRSLNLMSDPFQRVMRDLNTLLKTTYNADKVAIIPGYVSFLLFPS